MRPDRIIRMIRKAGGRALIGLVGVQSNQFPRAVDLARPFLAAGLPVCIGGFHVSGCLAMLPEMPPEIARGAGARHLVLRRRGRGRPARRGPARRLDGTLKPLYNYMDDLPALEGEPAPILPQQARAAHLGLAVEHRSRPRLPLPVLVLHHHQRAGPQEPVPHARRSREDRARELRAGHQAVLHHRRQFRPQPRLGAAVRPHDPAARAARA